MPRRLRKFRVLGRWKDEREFLVVLGDSEGDCQARLPRALAALTPVDWAQVESLWIEQWELGSDETGLESRWMPLEEFCVREIQRVVQTGGITVVRSPLPLGKVV